MIHLTHHRAPRRLALLAVVLLLVSASCSTPKDIVYFQDITADTVLQTKEPNQMTIRPNDKLSIVVNSRDPQLVDMFNLPYVTRQLGVNTRSEYVQTNNQGILSYSVDSKGDIDFPVLGTIHVGGLTRNECAAMIKGMLIGAGYVKDPTVTVDFLNTTYSVMGEVTAPGRYGLDRDNLTLLEALSEARDLTIYGKRENVKVVRTSADGTQATYLVDLTKLDDLRQSPVYYIEPGDVIYVEPNPTRMRQSTVNGNNVRSTSFWISLASLLTSMAVLIFK